MILLKSILHNVGVIAVGLGVGLLGARIDLLLGVADFRSVATTMAGCFLLSLGFVVRMWATVYFYKNEMKVISLAPHAMLLTAGPYRFSRNPLYLGGNVFIFFGAALLFGSSAALLATAIHLLLVDRFIQREERQLEEEFGEEWRRYRNQVRRWL